MDSGFFSEQAVAQVERAGAGPVVYAAVAKTGHHRSVADLEKKAEPAPPGADANGIAVMRHRLKTTAGKTLYKLRQQTVEPVFGIIKSVLGFRQFRLRGRAKVALEWTLVCLADNLKR
ncbi:MAG: transposase, partial [Methyloceanibacter sp.]